MQDDSALREQLLEAQMRLEVGEISEETFLEIERETLARIRELKGHPQGALVVSPRTNVAGVEVETWKPDV
jgi:hypothetical protein